MSTEIKPSDWESLKSWWSAYTETRMTTHYSSTARVLEKEQLIKSWDELDPWWECYSEIGKDIAEQIVIALDHSNEKWEQSSATFDTDPLSADLSLRRFSRGPLQPAKEIGWSRWLARLLRPSAELVTELFEIEVEKPPTRVSREERLSKQNQQGISFRRPDVLVFHTDCGVSIEVKLGDENYSKTADAARLVERKYDNREWTHALLLPKNKEDRLKSIVDPPIESGADGRLEIGWDSPGPVYVINWIEVTAAIRSLLRRDAVPDDHWSANAYLFCSIVEQQLLGFQPQPVVKQLTTTANAVDTVRPILLADTLEEQLTYLRERCET